jgi:hypothetical protein
LCILGSMSKNVVVRGPALVEDGWFQVLRYLRVDSEALDLRARQDRALVRRREIGSGSDLLRLAMAYALCKRSLTDTARWASCQEVADLSAVALYYRLRACPQWLGKLLAARLLDRQAWLGQSAVRLRLIDATTVSKPGSTGTDWRIHLSLDLLRMCLDEVEVTDARGGETLLRHHSQAGDIIVADAGYPHPQGLGEAISAGANLVVRTNWRNLPLRLSSGEGFDVCAWLRQLRSEDLAECALFLPTTSGTHPVRFIARRLSAKSAAAARKRCYEQARKKKHKIDERTVLAAGFALLVSNLPQTPWSTEQVAQLYQIRWQIEVHIRRLKGILHLGRLPVHGRDLAQTYLLCKLLAALVVDQIILQMQERDPIWFESKVRPASIWRLTCLAKDYIVEAICGPPPTEFDQLILPGCERYLCDTPRKRQKQSVQAMTTARDHDPNASQLPLHEPLQCYA